MTTLPCTCRPACSSAARRICSTGKLAAMGTRPEATVASDLARAPLPGELVLSTAAGAFSLGPFAVWRDGRPWLLREARPGSKVWHARAEPTFYSAGGQLPPATATFGYAADPGGPWGVRIA